MKIPALHGNWVDFLILIFVLFYVIEGYERGFLALAAEFISFIGSFLFAIKFYPLAAQFLMANFSFPNSFANATGFLVLAALSEIFLVFLANFVFERLPVNFWRSPLEKILGIFPAVVDCLLLVAFFLTLIISLPLRPDIKSALNNSKIGGFLISQTVQIEKDLSLIFGGAIEDTLTYLTVQPGSSKKINIPSSPQDIVFDSSGEAQMLVLVNRERRRYGLPELRWDSKIAEVARAHSKDMWERHYFSHIDPDGKDPAKRLEQAGIYFLLAGENIALAPSVSLAHQGLMNSEGHRENILNPKFKKIGIGIADGGIYGKMFTQDFTD